MEHMDLSKLRTSLKLATGKTPMNGLALEKNSYMRDAIERTFGDSLSVKVKEDIYITFQHFMKDEGQNTCSKVKELILHTLKIVTTAKSSSGKTVKVDSSNNEYISANAILDSEETVKVNSNGEYEDDELDMMHRKKRRLADQIGRSTHEEPQISLVKGRNLSQQSSGSKFESTSFQQQVQGVTTSETSFFGFKNNTTTQKVEPSSDQLPKSKFNIDINKAFLPDEEPAHTQTGQTSWARYLDDARKNYFFYDDDTPTLRLLENYDDCGNEIKEPELWRPLHMDSDAYNRKIEAAKRNGPANRIEGVDNIISKET